MKLLFDENLSPRLVQALGDLYPGSSHVHECGLASSPDMAMLIFANGSRNRSELRIRRHDRYEVSGIKTAECFSSLAARHDRNVIHISIVNHRVNRGRSIANREFVRRVFVP